MDDVTADRLSALDASFLAVERPSAPMHVGWVARFDPPEAGPRPGFAELFDHVAGRLGRAPRYRQRLARVPLALHEPLWVDDPGFDAANHLLPAGDGELDALVDGILSTPLARDGPLWEIWIADALPGGGIALIGKMHHCMVDGTAVVELGNLLLDPDPDAWSASAEHDGWTPVPAPSAGERLAQALVERAADGAALPPAPGSPLNRPGAAQRHHVRVTHSLDDVRAIRRRHGVTPNDVIIAACAGALRRFAERRGESPQRLKVMVP